MNICWLRCVVAAICYLLAISVPVYGMWLVWLYCVHADVLLAYMWQLLQHPSNSPRKPKTTSAAWPLTKGSFGGHLSHVAHLGDILRRSKLSRSRDSGVRPHTHIYGGKRRIEMPWWRVDCDRIDYKFRFSLMAVAWLGRARHRRWVATMATLYHLTIGVFGECKLTLYARALIPHGEREVRGGE